MTVDTKIPLHEAIQSAVEQAYADAIEYGPQNATPENVHREARACRVASFALFDELRNSGFPASQEMRSGLEVDEHRYVVVDRDDGTELVIDPTWQQFLPREVDGSEMPHVLIGSRDEVIDFARQSGVSEANLQLWAPKGVFTEPDNRPAHEKIAAAIDLVA